MISFDFANLYRPVVKHGCVGCGVCVEVCPHPSLPIRVVDETGTTLRARERYWQLWPARGWKRLLPKGLRIPSGDLDAIAALVILEDYLDRPLQWPGPDPLRTGLSR